MRRGGEQQKRKEQSIGDKRDSAMCKWRACVLKVKPIFMRNKSLVKGGGNHDEMSGGGKRLGKSATILHVVVGDGMFGSKFT